MVRIYLFFINILKPKTTADCYFKKNNYLCEN